MTKAKILLVEDEAIIAMGIKATLKKQGYEVLDTVSSGEEAIRKVAEGCPDLVLMDIELSGEMSGIEAARQIQKHFDIPVVYLTAHTADTILQEAKITEPYEYIFKPFEKEGLGIVIETALYKHKKEDDKIRKLPHAVEYNPATVMITDTKGLRVLVVDDEVDICNILDRFLSSLDHKVKAIGNGAEAIELIKGENFDFVLCDLGMPNVYGYDVIKALNKLERRPKVGIMTGWGEKLKPMDDEEFKVDFIIKKPFDLSELSKHINDVIGAE